MTDVGLSATTRLPSSGARRRGGEKPFDTYFMGGTGGIWATKQSRCGHAVLRLASAQ